MILFKQFIFKFIISKMDVLFKSLTLVGIVLYPGVSFASPCCARNAATPVLIVGDDQAQVNVGVAVGAVVAEAFDDGFPVFGSTDSSEISQTYRLDAATVLSDRLQAGVSLPMVNHTVARGGVSDSSMGVGDLRMSVGYEILPAWSYSKWKPQGFLFLATTIPTGRSIYDMNDSFNPTLSNVTGNGFYTFSVGTLLLKSWGAWDTFMIPEVHYSLPRTFQDTQQSFQVYPGWGGSIGWGGGWSPGGSSLRLGTRVQPRVDQARKVPNIQTAQPSQGVLATCDTGFDVSYLFSMSNTLMLSYTDQTLLGPSFNSNLNRILALNFQHRWER